MAPIFDRRIGLKFEGCRQAVAAVTFLSFSWNTDYEVRPEVIVRTRSGGWRLHPKVDSISLETVTRVWYWDGENDPGMRLSSPMRSYQGIPAGEEEQLYRVPGRRLAEHHHADTVQGNQTRIFLGLLGGRRPRQGPNATGDSGHTAEPDDRVRDDHQPEH